MTAGTNKSGGEIPPKILNDSADVTVADLIAILWRGKKAIAVSTAIVVVMSVLLALWLPPVYRATALVAPIEQEANMRLNQAMINPLSNIQLLNGGTSFSSSIKMDIAIL